MNRTLSPGDVPHVPQCSGNTQSPEIERLLRCIYICSPYIPLTIDLPLVKITFGLFLTNFNYFYLFFLSVCVWCGTW